MGRGRNYQQDEKRRQERRAQILEKQLEQYAGDMAARGRLQAGHTFKTTGIPLLDAIREIGNTLPTNKALEKRAEQALKRAAAASPTLVTGSALGITDWMLTGYRLDPMTPAEQAYFRTVGNTALLAGNRGATRAEAAKFALQNPGQAYTPKTPNSAVEAGTSLPERDISSVVDPVQDALGKAGYGPADPDVVADAYVEGRASGLTHEEAVEYAAGMARDAAPAGKVKEQNGNKTPQELEDWLSDYLNLVEGTPASGVQVASLGTPDFVADLIGTDPAAAGFKRTQARAQSAQTPWSQAAGPYDLAAEILGMSRPQMVSTPIGEVPLGRSDWLTDYEVEKGLMPHPAYSNANLPHSTPIRDTVRGFYTSAYPGTVALDAAGRIDPGPRVSRPASAPGLFQGKASAARPAEPVPATTTSPLGLAERQKAIGAGVEDSGSLWSAVQEATDSRRAAEREQDIKELEQTPGIEQRRDTAARISSDAVKSVTLSRTDTLGGAGTAKDDVGDGLLGTEKDLAHAAEAARSRAVADGTYVGALDQTTQSAASMTDASAKGKTSKKAYAVQDNSGSENETYAADFGTAVDDVGDDEEARVICTELVAQRRMAAELYHLDLRFAEERLSAAHLRGYHLWAVPLVRWMRRSRRVSALVAGPALWRAEEIAHLLGERQRGSLRGRIVRLIGEPLCRLIGCWAPETDYRKLYEQDTNA